MVEAICVDPARVSQIWPTVGAKIQRAYDVGGDDTFESIEFDVLKGNALLWLAHDNGLVKGAAVSKLWHSARQKICSVLAAAGDDLADWKHCLGAIETYASAEGCDVVRLSGRVGWKRIFPDYSQPWIILEKRL